MKKDMPAKRKMFFRVSAKVQKTYPPCHIVKESRKYKGESANRKKDKQSFRKINSIQKKNYRKRENSIVIFVP